MKKEKTYIIPNWYGVIFGFSILAAILLAATYSNNLVYVVAFFMLGLFLLGMVQANSNLKSLYLEKIEFALAQEENMGLGKIWLKNELNRHLFKKTCKWLIGTWKSLHHY